MTTAYVTLDLTLALSTLEACFDVQKKYSVTHFWLLVCNFFLIFVHFFAKLSSSIIREMQENGTDQLFAFYILIHFDCEVLCRILEIQFFVLCYDIWELIKKTIKILRWKYLTDIVGSDNIIFRFYLRIPISLK